MQQSNDRVKPNKTIGHKNPNTNISIEKNLIRLEFVILENHIHFFMKKLS